MAKYRNKLPQLDNRLFLTDGGLETTLVFLQGIDLPEFAAFELLKDPDGTEILRDYFIPYLELARRHGCGFVLETPTWRANPDWAARLGYDAESLADANRAAVGLMLEIRDRHETPERPLVVSGNIGPRGDGYRPGTRMSTEEAQSYHAAQIATYAQTDADLVTAMTLNYTEEAIGIVQAARNARMPAVISFTVETDGSLPDGTALREAVTQVDEATGGYAAYFMINCAHPSHFMHVLEEAGRWRERIRGIRANASRCSHAELDDSEELDTGDPAELGGDYRTLQRLLPHLSVLGGCCGTDHRHVGAIAAACNPERGRKCA